VGLPVALGAGVRLGVLWGVWGMLTGAEASLPSSLYQRNTAVRVESNDRLHTKDEADRPGAGRQAGRQAGMGPDLRTVLVGLPQGSGVPNGVGSAEGPARV
jgi:hypothetical protein